jgi:hypothetical protein
MAIYAFLNARASGMTPGTGWLVGVTIYAQDGTNVVEEAMNIFIPIETTDEGNFNQEIIDQATAWIRLQTQFGWQVGAIQMFFQRFSEST